VPSRDVMHREAHTPGIRVREAHARPVVERVRPHENEPGSTVERRDRRDRGGWVRARAELDGGARSGRRREPACVSELRTVGSDPGAPLVRGARGQVSYDRFECNGRRPGILPRTGLDRGRGEVRSGGSDLPLQSKLRGRRR
jgi:hypothetical protein